MFAEYSSMWNDNDAPHKTHKNDNNVCVEWIKMGTLQIRRQIIKTKEKIDLTKCQSSEYVTLIHSNSSHFLSTQFSFVLILPIKHRRYFLFDFTMLFEASRVQQEATGGKKGVQDKNRHYDD